MSESAVGIAYETGQWLRLNTGVRQAGVFSLLLFILYIDKYIQEVDDEKSEAL